MRNADTFAEVLAEIAQDASEEFTDEEIEAAEAEALAAWYAEID